MQKKWLYRVILSYIPIFFAVIFCLMLVFFLGVSELTRKQSLKAYGVYSQQVMHIVDSTLQNIDTLASKNLLLNEKVAAYFEQKGEQSPYSYYGVTEVLLDFAAPLPMIDSVYLYRAADGKVLMGQFSSELESFGDRSFIEEAMSSGAPVLWSGVRSLSLYEAEERQKTVVSLVKKVPYYSGGQGLIVINVHTGSLQALVNEMQDGSYGSACLGDAAGRGFGGPSRFCGPADGSDGSVGEEEEGGLTLQSAYTGWRLHMTVPQGGLFAFLSTFSYVWFGLGLLAVIGGIGAMTYVSHRHYRPIDQVVSRIRSFTEQKKGYIDGHPGKDKDEFAFIDGALVQLIELSNRFEEQQAGGLLYRRTVLFRELMEGTRLISKEELHREAGQLGLGASFEEGAAAVAELDAYPDFVARYSPADQLLFKFTLRSVLEEIAAEEEESLWTEWVTPCRLGLFYRRGDRPCREELAAKAARLAERARVWVEGHLKFTVTFGIGPAVKEPGEIHRSFRQAGRALERKLLLGPNRVIVGVSTPAPAGAGVETLTVELQEAAHLFRLGNPAWERGLHETFRTLAAGSYTREEVTGLLRLFKAQLKREMLELPPELQDAWQSEGLPRLAALPEEPEWLEPLRLELFGLLGSVERQLQKLRMSREHYTLAAQVREYILAHYAESELSLSQVSEAFGANQKTLSRIFKEEFGEKFVDYVAKVRVEQAKKLLAETAEPVQQIAERVGYLHPMSFIRVFKKVEGMTPGDYRKESGMRKEA